MTKPMTDELLEKWAKVCKENDRLSAEIRRMIEENERLREENERLKGYWNDKRDRCPQCGTGNPNLATLREENERLKKKLVNRELREDNERLAKSNSELTIRLQQARNK